MTSSRPYLIRAVYDWLLDNGLTPYITVDALVTGVEVPKSHIKEGKITLNIARSAVSSLSILNTDIQFDARFSGVSYHIRLPVSSVMAVYASENGRGMIFSDEGDGGEDDKVDLSSRSTEKSSRLSGRPHLKVVK